MITNNHLCLKQCMKITSKVTPKIAMFCSVLTLLFSVTLYGTTAEASEIPDTTGEDFAQDQMARIVSLLLTELQQDTLTTVVMPNVIKEQRPEEQLVQPFADMMISGQALELIYTKANLEQTTKGLLQKVEQEKMAAQAAPVTKITDESGQLLGNFVVTAYCNCTKCQGQWVGQTASGNAPSVGRTIAVDPKVIPLGSRIHIEGIGWRIAEDTGGAIKGQRIDVLMDNHKECLTWGKRTLQVWSEID